MNTFLLWLLLFHLIPASAVPRQALVTTKSTSGATYTFVAAANSGGACGSVPCYATITPGAPSDFIRIQYYWSNGSAPTITGYDNGTTVYNLGAADNAVWQAGEYVGEIYVCGTTGSPTRIGVNGTTPSGGFGILVQVEDYSVTGSCSLKQSAARNTGTGTTLTGGAVTTTIAAGMIGGACFQHGIAQAITGTSSFTNRGDDGAGGSGTASGMDRIVSSTGTYTPTGTVSSSAPFLCFGINY